MCGSTGKNGAAMGDAGDGREVIRRRNDEGWTAGNFDVAYELIAPTTTVHGAGGQTVGMGPDGFIGLLKAWRTGFPDGYMTIDDLLVDGEPGVIRNTWHGTHEGTSTAYRPAGHGSPSPAWGSTG